MLYSFSLASLLLCFRAITKQHRGDLDTGTAIPPQSACWLKWPLSDKWVSSMYLVGLQDRRMIRVPGQQRGGTRFDHLTQNGAQFKTYELFTSGIFHLLYLDLGWRQVTELPTAKSCNGVGVAAACKSQVFSEPELTKSSPSPAFCSLPDI